MPLGHRKLSAWYHQLAQQLDAGVSFPEALRLSHGLGVSAADLNKLSVVVDAGGTIDDTFSAAAPWMPIADRLVLAASASTGQLPRTLRALSSRHAQLGAAKLRILLACLYPAAILHFGLLLLPLVRMIDWEKGFIWSSTAYVRGLALTIIPLWVVALAVWVMVRRQSPITARIASAMPFVAGYARAQALADLAFALGIFLEAGVPIGRAWATMGIISRSSKLKIASEAMAAVVARGAAPSSKMSEWRCFPSDFVALYRTGESTGKVDENLLRLAAQYQEQANRALTLSTMFYPAVMFLVVAGAVGYFVITLYSGYLKMLTDLADS